MANNYLKIVGTTLHESGAILAQRSEYVPFDDRSEEDTARAKKEAWKLSVEVASQGLEPRVSVYRPCCTLVDREGRSAFPVIVEFYHAARGRR